MQVLHLDFTSVNSSRVYYVSDIRACIVGSWCPHLPIHTCLPRIILARWTPVFQIRLASTSLIRPTSSYTYSLHDHLGTTRSWSPVSTPRGLGVCLWHNATQKHRIYPHTPLILHQPQISRFYVILAILGPNLNGISVSRPPFFGERPYPRQFHPVEFRRFSRYSPTRNTLTSTFTLTSKSNIILSDQANTVHQQPHVCPICTNAYQYTPYAPY